MYSQCNVPAVLCNIGESTAARDFLVLVQSGMIHQNPLHSLMQSGMTHQNPLHSLVQSGMTHQNPLHSLMFDRYQFKLITFPAMWRLAEWW